MDTMITDQTSASNVGRIVLVALALTAVNSAMKIFTFNKTDLAVLPVLQKAIFITEDPFSAKDAIIHA